MVEENFWFSWSGMLQNGGFGLLISEYIHQRWRKLFIFVVRNSPAWRTWTTYRRISSPWLKNIFDFRGLECSKIEDLECVSQNIFSKVEIVLIFVIWSAPEWRTWITYRRISSPWLKKIFDFRGLKCSRMENLEYYNQNTFTKVEESL